MKAIRHTKVGQDLVRHNRAKHIDMLYHRACVEVKFDEVMAEYCTTSSMIADLMHIGLPGLVTKNKLAAFKVANVDGSWYCHLMLFATHAMRTIGHSSLCFAVKVFVA